MKIGVELTFRPNVALDFQRDERHQREDQYPSDDRHETEVHVWVIETQAFGG